ncbi:hypothetical protein JTE90_026969 [Oedothorax gibbosus]|uniref:Uncharacterized protein n=1 Tax=Oedothorax gibbosus TaxID=931172 RepID=A0AAV6TCZ7_9ARAC|nr:hypothetical protein JTE90_026969 [Oedothorax gibbosus]
MVKRTGTKIFTISPPDFQGAKKAPNPRAKARDARGFFREKASPIFRASRFPGTELFSKKKITLPPGFPFPRNLPNSVFVFFPGLGPRRTFSVSPGFGGIFKPPSLFGRETRQTRAKCFSFRETPRFGTDFSDPLGPTEPMFNCCSHGTLLHLQSSRLSLEYLLLHQDLTGGGSRRALRPAPSTHATRPSYSLSRKLSTREALP